MSDSFALAEALWRLGWLDATKARAAAIEAIAEGYDAPTLYELIEGGYGTVGEVHDLFARLLAELGRSPLEPGAAAIRFARVAAREVASGSLAPLAALRANWRELWDDRELPEVLLPFVRLAVRYELYSYEPGLLPDYPAEIAEAARRLIEDTENDG